MFSLRTIICHLAAYFFNLERISLLATFDFCETATHLILWIINIFRVCYNFPSGHNTILLEDVSVIWSYTYVCWCELYIVCVFVCCYHSSTTQCPPISASQILSLLNYWLWIINVILMHKHNCYNCALLHSLLDRHRKKRVEMWLILSSVGNNVFATFARLSIKVTWSIFAVNQSHAMHFCTLLYLCNAIVWLLSLTV